MEFTVHHQVLAAVFVIAAVLGAIVSKTNFCTMGAVSDWINMGDTGRMRSWLLAMAVAIAGVAGLEAGGLLQISGDTFPPYRTANFGWLRYLAGGALFGIGMTLSFASQGAGRMKAPFAAGLTRLFVASLGGWFAIEHLGWGLPGVFVAIAVGIVTFGSLIAGPLLVHPWRGRT